MRTPRPLLLAGALGAIGLLTPAASALAAAVDTSAWKCTSCPYEKGATGRVEAGVAQVSKEAVHYIDRTGLDKGAHLLLGGSASYRDGEGLFGSFSASDLGLDSRSLAGQIGIEGAFTLRLSYDELTRRFAEGASTPFIGSGGNVLTLPAGYPAATTADMPLASTLQPLTLGYDRSRLDAGLSLAGGEGWTYRVSARRDKREGTKAGAASFFSTTAQLAVPVDYVTDQVEVSASFAGSRLQATLAYQLSNFSNGQGSLTFANPFTPVLAGADTGQLALAPDNKFHQLSATLGYDISPGIRASADFAIGRMTQDAAYLASTLTPSVAAGLAPLPAASLNGQADTFNGAFRLSAAPIEGLRINASYARDVRDSGDTAVLAYPAVATDLFVAANTVSNTPYSVWQDRIKLVADYRVSDDIKTAAGFERDSRERSYSEVVTTRENTVWGRVTGQLREDLSLAVKLARSKRGSSEYGVSTWTDRVENPLLRRFNLAKRDRLASTVRLDWTASETLSAGLGVDIANDKYRESVLGLQDGRSVGVTADVAWAYSEQTQLRAYAQRETMRSHQVGSQLSSTPDWTGRVKDTFRVVGLGVKHMAMDNKLELDADLNIARSRSDTRTEIATATPEFPAATTAQDSLKLSATYQLKDNLSLVGSVQHERYEAKDWRIDGVQPDTVPYLLAFGQVSPKYSLNVLRLAVRYSY